MAATLHIWVSHLFLIEGPQAMSSVNASNSKKPIKVAVAVGALVLAGLIFLFSLGTSDSAPTPAQQWFYDVGNGQLFSVAPQVLAPVNPPSGATLSDGRPGGVKAHVYACGSCDSPDDRFVGYVTLYPPEVHASPRGPLSILGSMIPAAIPDSQNPAKLDWRPHGEIEGKINSQLRNRCDGSMPNECAHQK